MRLGRPLPGQWLAALGGLGLIVSLWLSWYEITGPDLPQTFIDVDDLDTSVTAWQSFDVTDLVLFAAGAFAISLPIVALTQRTPAIPIALDSIATLVGLLAVALVVFRTLNLPGVEPPPPFDLERRIGLWVALVSALAMVAGALLSMRSEGPEQTGWQPGEESPVPARPVPDPKPDSAE